MALQDPVDALPINVLDYCTGTTQLNAVLAGTVGIDVPMAPALAAAKAAGRPLYIPGRYKGSPVVYTTTANTVIYNPGVTIYGNDATIRKVGYDPLFSNNPAYSSNPSGPGSDPALSGGRLASNATKGAISVTLTDPTTPFAVGDWVVVMDRTRIYGSANSCRAEFQLIQAKDDVAKTVTFWSPLKYDYLAGTSNTTSARLVKAPFLSNVGYHDLNIVMDDSVDLTEHVDNHAFDHRWLYNGTFQNIRISNFLNAGFRMQNCLNCNISDIELSMGGSATSGTSDPSSSEGRPGASYGVCEAALNMDLKVSAVTASNLRHLYTTVATAKGTGTPADYGEPFGTIISDCVHTYPINAGFDTHEAGQNISFLDCKVVGGHFVGMQIRSKGTVVRNFEVHDTIGAAVWIRGGQSNNAYADLTVIDGVVANRTNLGVSFDGWTWQNMGAVVDEAPRSRISRIAARFTGGPALEMYRNAAFSSGKYADIDALDICQNTTTDKYVVAVRQIAASNAIDIDTVTSTSTDGKVTNLVKIVSNSGTVRLRNVHGTGHSGEKVDAAGTGVVTMNADTEYRVERSDAQAQYFRQYSNASGHIIQSYSPSASSPKNFVIDVNTDAAGTAPTGDLQFNVQINGLKGVGSDHRGQILQQGSVVFDGNRLPLVRSYTVATLPTTVSAGTLAYASNGRAFNGAGVLESAGSGSGVLVNRTSTAWKIVGTNQTVQA